MRYRVVSDIDEFMTDMRAVALRAAEYMLECGARWVDVQDTVFDAWLDVVI